MRTIRISLLVACFVSALASADVIRTQDGTVYIGKVVAADGKGVTLDTFGSTVVVNPGTILSTETGKPDLQASLLEVFLKDGSVIRGTVVDYDPEIGLLIDMEFGTLTIPFENLKTIQDPQQRSQFKGFPVIAAITTGYYFTVGSFADSFAGGLSISLQSVFDTHLVRGLSAGLEATQYFMNYLPSTEVSYSATSVTFSPVYRLLLLRSSSLPIVRDMVPWVGAGGGIAYVWVRDRRVGAYQPSYGELDPAWCASLGIDFFLGKRVLIRLSGAWIGIQQSSGLLSLPAVRLGAAVNF